MSIKEYELDNAAKHSFAHQDEMRKRTPTLCGDKIDSSQIIYNTDGSPDPTSILFQRV